MVSLKKLKFSDARKRGFQKKSSLHIRGNIYFSCYLKLFCYEIGVSLFRLELNGIFINDFKLTFRL